MAGSILATKLYIPTPRANTIARSHLIQRLNSGLERKMTLISAPAGFGKTTCVTSWIASHEQLSVAWLSLNEQDSDAVHFLKLIVAGFQTVVPSFDEGMSMLLQAPQSSSTIEILTTLINELTLVPHKLVLVLDDYHLVDSAEVDTAVTFFIDHLPPNLHLILTTREDPQLPLSRYRGRGEMNEIRAIDLRFTPTEAIQFLNDNMGLTLTKDDVTALDARTEGWIAGLQMAALSLYGRSDTTHFVQAFKGSHRFVLDYLVDEVLQNQPETVRDFLLKTAVLERFNAPLCDAVTLKQNSHLLLETLERHNLFLIPLDDNRQWYRYHHLFADMLKTHVHHVSPAEIIQLHKRASQWFETHQFVPEAVEHALQAQDLETVARLCEIHWPIMYRSFQASLWYRWVNQLPPDYIQNRPLLATGLALSLLNKRKPSDVKRYLEMAEKWVNFSANGLAENNNGPLYSDEQQFAILPATIATAKAMLAQANQDTASIIKYARKALSLLPEDQYSGRVLPLALLGLTHFSQGNLDETYHYFVQVQACFFKDGDVYWGLGPTRILANIRQIQGRLTEAQKLYHDAVQIALKQERGIFPGLAELYFGLAEVALLRGDLETAVIHKEKAQSLGNLAIVPGNQFRLNGLMASIEAACGRFDEAMELLNESAGHDTPTFLPEIRPMWTVRVRLLLKNGRLMEAQQTITRQNITFVEPLSFEHELPNLTLAKVQIETVPSDQLSSLIQFLNRLLEHAEQGKRQLHVLDSLLILSRAYEKTGDQPMAFKMFARALQLAQPEDCLQPFLEYGGNFGTLIPLAENQQKVATDSQLQQFIKKIGENSENVSKPILDQPLLDPLSKRELEILSLIAQGLSNQEICDKLFLALNTVKGHNHRIFSKLHVQRRTEAVARARQLGLIQ